MGWMSRRSYSSWIKPARSIVLWLTHITDWQWSVPTRLCMLHGVSKCRVVVMGQTVCSVTSYLYCSLPVLDFNMAIVWRMARAVVG